MIEITKRLAVGLSSAVKVLTAMQLVPDEDPLTWIRTMGGNFFVLNYSFWVRGNPDDSLDIDVFLVTTSKPCLTWMVLVHYPHSDQVERWDFDNEGKIPTRVK